MPDRKPDDVLTARDEVAGCREGSSIHCVGYGALGLRVASPPPGDRIIPGVGEGWGAVELLGAHAPPSRALLGGARDDIRRYSKEPPVSAEGLEDCIAMAEDGFSWFAFPKTMKRGRVMAKLARNAEITGWDWPYVIKAYRIRSGHVQESDNRYGWWSECPAEEPGAVPAWIVRLRGVS